MGPETLPDQNTMLWTAHTAARPHLEAVMTAQIGIMKARDEGPTAGALALTSVGLGPDDTFASLEVDEDMDMDEEDDGEDGESEEDEMCEGEEEEDEEEEEEDSDDEM